MTEFGDEGLAQLAAFREKYGDAPFPIEGGEDEDVEPVAAFAAIEPMLRDRVFILALVVHGLIAQFGPALDANIDSALGTGKAWSILDFGEGRRYRLTIEDAKARQCEWTVQEAWSGGERIGCLDEATHRLVMTGPRGVVSDKRYCDRHTDVARDTDARRADKSYWLTVEDEP